MSRLPNPYEYSFWHYVWSKVLVGKLDVPVSKFWEYFEDIHGHFSQPISGRRWLLANTSFLIQNYSVNKHSRVFMNNFSLKKCFWKRDKQVIIEFKATPIPPTSPSDIITISLVCAYLNIFWFWLSSNQIAFLAPTQTHNLEASLQWRLVQFNYNAFQSRKLFKGQEKLCIFSLFSWKHSEIYICSWSHIET